MTAPKVSIVIPTFNREDLIGACIDSALAQTFKDFEIVISDNASTDGTWAICQKYAENDHRIRLFRNATNIGPVRNWARCFAEAKGVYCKVLFSDDVLYPTYLASTLPTLEHEDVAFVFTATEIGMTPGSGQQAYRWRKCSGIYRSKDYVEDALLSGGVPKSPGAAIFRLADLRKNLVFDIPGFNHTDFKELGAGSDLLLYLLTALQYSKVGYVDQTLVFFRSHPDSITNRYGVVPEDYKKASLWFARETLSSNVANSVFIRFWVEEMRQSGSWINFTQFSHSCERGTGKVSVLSFVSFIWKKIIIRLRRAVARPCMWVGAFS